LFKYGKLIDYFFVSSQLFFLFQLKKKEKLGKWKQQYFVLKQVDVL
jgi:hypothetical protein